jgi:hypothetical protein
MVIKSKMGKTNEKGGKKGGVKRENATKALLL